MMPEKTDSMRIFTSNFVVNSWGNGTHIDGWPELNETLQNLLSPKSSPNRQRLFYAFISEYPTVVADMPVQDLLQCLRMGLGAIDKDVSLVSEALKACVAVLRFDDRFEEFKGLIPEMLNVGFFRSMCPYRESPPPLKADGLHVSDMRIWPSTGTPTVSRSKRSSRTL